MRCTPDVEGPLLPCRVRIPAVGHVIRIGILRTQPEPCRQKCLTVAHRLFAQVHLLAGGACQMHDPVGPGLTQNGRRQPSGRLCQSSMGHAVKCL